MKTIEIDLFDPQSIDAAVKQLRKFAKERERKIDLYLMRLAQLGEVTAQRAYGGQVQVRAHKNRYRQWEVRAEGDQVIFLEFGAGVYTEDHALTIGSNLNIIIAPGGWSETEGEGTWGRWVADGKPLDKYPYNQRPRAGMYEAYKAIVANQYRIAEEVFGK